MTLYSVLGKMLYYDVYDTRVILHKCDQVSNRPKAIFFSNFGYITLDIGSSRHRVVYLQPAAKYRGLPGDRLRGKKASGRVPEPCGEIPQAHPSMVTGAKRP